MCWSSAILSFEYNDVKEEGNWYLIVHIVVYKRQKGFCGTGKVLQFLQTFELLWPSA